MSAFLTSISDFFSALGGFILNIVYGIIYIFALIPKALAYIAVALGYIPAPVLPFAGCAIAICVVFLILNK